MKKNILKKRKLKSKKGAELIESMLLIALVVSIAFVLFYPMMSRLFTTVSNEIELKFLNSINLIA